MRLRSKSGKSTVNPLKSREITKFFPNQHGCDWIFFRACFGRHLLCRSETWILKNVLRRLFYWDLCQNSDDANCFMDWSQNRENHLLRLARHNLHIGYSTWDVSLATSHWLLYMGCFIGHFTLRPLLSPASGTGQLRAYPPMVGHRLSPGKPTRSAVTTMGSNDFVRGKDHLLGMSYQQYDSHRQVRLDGLWQLT